MLEREKHHSNFLESSDEKEYNLQKQEGRRHPTSKFLKKVDLNKNFDDNVVCQTSKLSPSKVSSKFETNLSPPRAVPVKTFSPPSGKQQLTNLSNL